MSSSTDASVRLTVWVQGEVQGVGFRWWTRSRALELGLTGQARNLSDGRVAVTAEGERAACEQLRDLLRDGDTPGRVRSVSEQWGDATGSFTGFVEA
ncbi:acylphosphatase [Pseudonocardia nematodicida]|uniref:acylphosphatase n=1 Tax=Pseudonocardia nematodicida TaxID=1206997 RepID=A0ABV1KK27_9PSEU